MRTPQAHETKLARAEEEAAQAKRPLEAKTARLEAQRQAWEAEKASLLQEQARLAAENERWRAKAQDHSTRSQELAHRLADADKAAELARSAAQIEHAQAERLREIWEADKKLLLQDHILLTSDLLELKGRSESHYSESRELERALSAAAMRRPRWARRRVLAGNVFNGLGTRVTGAASGARCGATKEELASRILAAGDRVGSQRNSWENSGLPAKENASARNWNPGN